MILCNLKDNGNDTFWRRVILGEISASTLYRMESSEMASREKMLERKQHHDDALEQIKTIEDLKQKEVLYHFKTLFL